MTYDKVLIVNSVKRDLWPVINLQDHIVIAYFLNEFKSTEWVLENSAINGAPAILIESVLDAAEEVRNFYDGWCQRYLYDYYRVLHNSVTYWTVFIRRGWLQHTWGKMILRHRRQYATPWETPTPVARWLLEEIRLNLENRFVEYDGEKRVYEIYPGDIADLRVIEKEAYAQTL